jgi:hypothetical protein
MYNCSKPYFLPPNSLPQIHASNFGRPLQRALARFLSFEEVSPHLRLLAGLHRPMLLEDADRAHVLLRCLYVRDELVQVLLPGHDQNAEKKGNEWIQVQCIVEGDRERWTSISTHLNGILCVFKYNFISLSLNSVF